MPRRKRTTAMRVRELTPGSTVFVYLRDSGGQAQERSIAEQRAATERHAAQQGWIVTGWFVDEGVASGDWARRVRFMAMIDACKRVPPPVDGVLTYSFSRFGRDEYDSQFYRLELRRHGVQVVSVIDNIPGGPMASIFEAFVDWKNRAFLDDLSHHTREGFLRNIQAGCVPGGFPPVGYVAERVTIGVKRDGSARIAPRWLVDPEMAARVRRAFEMMAEGATYSRIHDEVHLLRSPTGYRDMFANRTYLGIVKFGAEEFAGVIEPIVDPDLFAAVQARMGSRKAQAGRARRMTSAYLLSGMAVCGVCGTLMRGDSDTRREELGRYYRCRAPGCALGRVPAGPPERKARDAVLDLLTPENMARLLERMRAAMASPEVEAELASVREQIGPLRRVVENLIDACENGAGAKTAERLAVREGELAQLEERERMLSQRLQLAGSTLTAGDLAEVVEGMRAQVTSDEVEVARLALGRFVERVVMYEGGEARVDLRGAGFSEVPPAGFVMMPAKWSKALDSTYSR